jgi:hypothetical protein
MYDKAGLWKFFFQPLLCTFPQANSELKNLFLLFSQLLHKNE